MTIKSLVCLIKRKFEIHSNLMKICNKITQVLFLKHVSRNSLHDPPSTWTVYAHLTSLLCKNTN